MSQTDPRLTHPHRTARKVTFWESVSSRESLGRRAAVETHVSKARHGAPVFVVMVRRWPPVHPAVVGKTTTEILDFVQNDDDLGTVGRRGAPVFAVMVRRGPPAHPAVVGKTTTEILGFVQNDDDLGTVGRAYGY